MTDSEIAQLRIRCLEIVVAGQNVPGTPSALVLNEADAMFKWVTSGRLPETASKA